MKFFLDALFWSNEFFILPEKVASTKRYLRTKFALVIWHPLKATFETKNAWITINFYAIEIEKKNNQL